MTSNKNSHSAKTYNTSVKNLRPSTHGHTTSDLPLCRCPLFTSQTFKFSYSLWTLGSISLTTKYLNPMEDQLPLWAYSRPFCMCCAEVWPGYILIRLSSANLKRWLVILGKGDKIFNTLTFRWYFYTGWGGRSQRQLHKETRQFQG